MIGQPCGHGLGAIEHAAGQGQVFAGVAGTAAQEIAAADIWEQADARLGHRHPGALGHDTVTRALRDAHAAPHDDAIHQRHDRLGIVVDQVVQPVFLGEEILQCRIARARRLMEETDVAAGAERTERSHRAGIGRVAAAAAQRHQLHRRVVAPGQQQAGQVADHVQRQGVERLRPCQRDQSCRAAAPGLYKFHHCHPAGLLCSWARSCGLQRRPVPLFANQGTGCGGATDPACSTAGPRRVSCLRSRRNCPNVPYPAATAAHNRRPRHRPETPPTCADWHNRLPATWPDRRRG